MRPLLVAAAACFVLGTPVLAQERFPRLTPDQMTPEQKALAAAIQGGPRASVPGRDNSIGGPFNPWLRSPRSATSSSSWARSCASTAPSRRR